MIGSLRGTLGERAPKGAHVWELELEVGGVGYRVSVPASVAASLPGEGTEVRLVVHTHVREDAIVLYGFADRAQRSCFEALIDAPRVGPSLALAVLSVLSPPELFAAVTAEDFAALSAVPGVGAKLARSLVVELKGRLDPALEEQLSSFGEAVERPDPGAGAGLAELRLALAGLGYSSEEIRQAARAVSPTEPVAAQLRQALVLLGGRR